MYNDSTPIGGKISSIRGNLVTVSKSNPCPHCGKPDWCYSIGELSVCNRDQPPATGWEATRKTDDNGKFFYAPPQEKKPARPKQTRCFPYPDRDGSPLARVMRVDDGEGKKKIWQEHWDGSNWQKGIGDVVRANIPVYRCADVQKAIANSEPIFVVDGEQCADILWELGLAATTSIGGMGKFSLTDSLDLQGAPIVIVLDRDEPGVKDSQKVAQHFPEAMWLYPYPGSKAWENLPKSQGLDVFDWIKDKKLSASDIKAAIAEKEVFEASPTVAKVLTHPKFETSSLDSLLSEIDNLLDADLKRSALKLEILKLSEKYRRSEKEVSNLYRTREDEKEQSDNREDVSTEVARLLDSKNSQINIAEIIPPALAAPIAELAARLNLKPECYLTTLLTQVSSLLKVGSEVKLRNDTNYRVTPNYFAGIVAESSQKKSPIMREIIDRPMAPLREKARKEFEKAYEAYEQELASWKLSKGEDKGAAPKAPRQKLYSFSKTTGEGILYQVAEHPDQGLMYRCDELASLFKSANQYRGGKGSDDEDLLEYWNGTGSTVLRASGVKADLDGLLLSVFGTIQPDVLAALLKDCSDSNGKFARFDFVIQPLAASKLSLEDSGSFDLTPMLSSLYQKIDALPALKLELDTDAKRYFTQFYNKAEDKRVAEPMQGKRAMIGKAPEKVGKLAVVIHTLNCIFNNQPVTTHISRDVIKAAVKFVMFTASQIDVLYTEFSDRTALAPNLVKILTLAERKGGTISTREAQHAFHVRQRPSAQQIREWFAELESMNYGELTTVKKTVSFCLTTTTVTTVASNSYTARLETDHTSSIPYTTVTTVNETTVVHCGTTVVIDVPQSEPLSCKDLKPTVVTVVPNSASSEKPENLLLSPATSQPLKSAAIPKALRTFELGYRVVVADPGLPIYHGQYGVVLSVCYVRDGQECRVRFDKKVRGIETGEFLTSQLMLLSK